MYDLSLAKSVHVVCTKRTYIYKHSVTWRQIKLLSHILTSTVHYCALYNGKSAMENSLNVLIEPLCFLPQYIETSLPYVGAKYIYHLYIIYFKLNYTCLLLSIRPSFIFFAVAELNVSIRVKLRLSYNKAICKYTSKCTPQPPSSANWWIDDII